MAQFKPCKITSNKLNSLPIIEGQLIITTDTKKIYLDSSNSNRILLNEDVDIITYEISKSGNSIVLTGSNGQSTTVTDNNTTYTIATQSANGLMSAEDKKKLDGIAIGAQVNTITGVKGNSESAYRTGNINITKTNIGLGNVDNKSSATIRGEITSANVTTALGYTPINSNLKGASNGLAELDVDGKVLSSQLPSYVDDVLEYNTKTNFPETGETGKIYVDKTTNKTYRWGGTAYVEISSSLALGTTSSTAFRGDYGNTAYTHSQKTSGNPHNVTKSDVGLGNVDNTADANKSVKYAATAGDAATVSGHTVAKDVPSNAVFTDTNTWVKASTTADGYISKLSGNTSQYLRGDGTWATPPNTTYNVMGAATSSAAGKSGLVPAPAAGKQTSFLRGDGNWVVPTNTTYNVATQSANGLMSSGDKTKLDGIAAGAQKNTITGVKGNSESKYRTGNVNITKANIGLGNVDNTADANKSVKSATKATQDSIGQQINSTYIKELSISGKTITYTKGDGTTKTITSQDVFNKVYVSKTQPENMNNEDVWFVIES